MEVSVSCRIVVFFFFNAPATTEIYTLSLHDALPILGLIGLSRVYLGAHYVTDVFVGWAIGLVLGGGAAYFLKTKVFSQKKER